MIQSVGEKKTTLKSETLKDKNLPAIILKMKFNFGGYLDNFLNLKYEEVYLYIRYNRFILMFFFSWLDLQKFAYRPRGDLLAFWGRGTFSNEIYFCESLSSSHSYHTCKAKHIRSC